jgi:hypothetical protein
MGAGDLPASDYQATWQTAWPHSRGGFAIWPRTLVNLRPGGALFAAVAVGIAVGPADSLAEMTRMPAWRRPGPGGPPGLQNRCEQRPCSGGFDSRPPPLTV